MSSRSRAAVSMPRSSSQPPTPRTSPSELAAVSSRGRWRAWSPARSPARPPSQSPGPAAARGRGRSALPGPAPAAAPARRRRAHAGGRGRSRTSPPGPLPAAGLSAPATGRRPWRRARPTGWRGCGFHISALAGVWSARQRNAASISGAAFFSRWLYSLCRSSRGNRCPTQDSRR